MTIAERHRKQHFRSKVKEETEMRLLVEVPNMPISYLPWNVYSQGQFCLTKEDVEVLEAGETLWHGEIALSLEEEPCEKS